MPAVFDEATFKKQLAYDKVSMVEEKVEVTFEMFYKNYPNKKNPDRAKKYWDGMTKTDKLNAYVGVSAFIKYCARETWYSCPLPERYLKDKYWNNNYK